LKLRTEKPLGIANALESSAKFLNQEFMIVNPNDIFDLSAYQALLKNRQQIKAPVLSSDIG